MKKLDENKIKSLSTAGKLLDKKYGKSGTESRTDFHAKATAWYYGEILKDRRKELKMTQQQLADTIGLERSYIARIEKGETDLQLSSFIRIARALKLKLSISAIL